MEENTRLSAKQRVLQAQGKEVPLDLFLYSCLERERIIKATAGTGAPEIRWPLLMPNEDGSLPEDLESMPLSSLVTRLAVWYRDQFPAMAETRPLDHEQMTEVIPGLVGLNQDLDRLYKFRTGDDLPDFEGSVGNNKFWDDIVNTVQDFFPAYNTYFLRYIQWSHAAEKEEHFEPGSRPPVGRYAPPPVRSGGDRGRGGPRGGDRGRGGGPRGDRGPRGFSDGGPRGGRGPRSERGNGPRGERGNGPRGGRGGPRGGRGNDEATARLTEAALAEVDQAIDKLRSHPEIDEVTLKPTNSFYRRIQHQKVVESGYHSFSVGEGNDRAVKVARREDE